MLIRPTFKGGEDGYALVRGMTARPRHFDGVLEEPTMMQSRV